MKPGHKGLYTSLGVSFQNRGCCYCSYSLQATRPVFKGKWEHQTYCPALASLEASVTPTLPMPLLETQRVDVRCAKALCSLALGDGCYPNPTMQTEAERKGRAGFFSVTYKDSMRCKILALL